MYFKHQKIIHKGEKYTSRIVQFEVGDPVVVYMLIAYAIKITRGYVDC